MKTFNVDLKLELKVTFSDLELAEKYLIGDDAEFAQCFYCSDDMEEFLNSFTIDIAHQILHGWYSELNIEGFAPFIRNGNTLTSIADEYGTITVVNVNHGLEVDFIY